MGGRVGAPDPDLEDGFLYHRLHIFCSIFEKFAFARTSCYSVRMSLSITILCAIVNLATIALTNSRFISILSAVLFASNAYILVIMFRRKWVENYLDEIHIWLCHTGGEYGKFMRMIIDDLRSFDPIKHELKIWRSVDRIFRPEVREAFEKSKRGSDEARSVD